MHEKPQDRQSPGRDLNAGPPEYEAGVSDRHHNLNNKITEKITQ
jgi:hypothetical protein